MEELGWHIKRTVSEPRDKLQKRARRAPLYNNCNAQLRNKLAEIRREMGCGNLKM